MVWRESDPQGYESSKVAAVIIPYVQGRGLDIGCGANIIYPLIGAAEYNFQMVGTDINSQVLEIATKNSKCSKFAKQISTRLQPQSENIFQNIIKERDFFDFSMCNPPFYSSLKDATGANERKMKNLNLRQRNFVIGTGRELHCRGGELKFIRNMIHESYDFRDSLGWITSLVADKNNLFILEELLKRGFPPHNKRPKQTRVLNIQTGNKITRILAWCW